MFSVFTRFKCFFLIFVVFLHIQTCLLQSHWKSQKRSAEANASLTIFASCLCFPNDAFPLVEDLNTRIEEYFAKVDPTWNERVIARDLIYEIYEREKAEKEDRQQRERANRVEEYFAILNITDPTSNERLIARDLICAKKEAHQQRERATVAEFARETLQKELNKFKYPIAISEEIEIFFELHDWKVNITAAEDKKIKQIRDQPKRVRTKMVKICEHIISDLNSTEPEIQDLNEEIDSPNNKELKKIADPSKRRNVFCNALVGAQVKRNKIRDLITDGTDLKKYNMFARESWNECISIFVNVLTANQGLKESEEEFDISQS